MEAEKGKTAKFLRDKLGGAPKQAVENLKAFNQVKKRLLEALGEEELTIRELSEKTGLSVDETTYQLLSLVKYGQVKVGQIDDMDEYYSYKLNK